MLITEINDKHRVLINGFKEIKTFGEGDVEIDYKKLVSSDILKKIQDKFSQLCLKSFLFYSESAVRNCIIKTGFKDDWNFSVSLNPLEVSKILEFIEDGFGTIAESELKKIGVIYVEYISTDETNQSLLKHLKQIAKIERLPWPNSKK
jgi:hypothetical protein